MSRLAKVAVVLALIVVAAVVVVLKKETIQQTAEGQATASQPAARLPRLVDLGSKTCIPCKMMAPILEELKKEYAEKLQVEFIDVNENREAAQRYGIRLIPTQVFFDASGKELWRHEGFMSKEDILEKWKELGVNLAAELKLTPR